MQFFCRSAALPPRSVSALSDSRGALRRRVPQTRGHAGAGHAPDDGRVAVPALAFLRRVCARLLARGVSRQRHSVALGQYESGVRPLPAVGGVSFAACDSGAPADAETEVADFGDAGWQTRAAVLLSFVADSRRAGRNARALRGGGPAARARCPGL